VLDTDDSKGLSCEEFRMGIKKLVSTDQLALLSMDADAEPFTPAAMAQAADNSILYAVAMRFGF
jgi:hypothetical protein